MAYKLDTIATTVEYLNRSYFLPAIQREFVWDTGQIVMLFDSILRGYPISSFLYWKLATENKEKWQTYKFIGDARDGGKRNRLASVAGVSDLTIVLDVQQRFTSLLIGLKGSYTIKKPRMWWNNPDAWERRKLYINLLKDPAADTEDGEEGIRYGLKFLKAPKNRPGEHWFEVGKILQFDDEDEFYDYKESLKDGLPDDTTKGAVKVFDKNIDRLFRAIWRDEAIAYYVETDQDYDRVLDIFVRANEGGTKLSKSDLLLSMITAKWQGIDAREEIYSFVDRLNSGLEHHNDFDKDFVMKSCLVLADLPVAYRVENFNNKNLDIIRTRWSQTKKAIERCVRLVNIMGVDRETLTSANALIPIAYYLLQNPDVKITSSSAQATAMFTDVRKWLMMVLVNNVFGGASDNALREVRGVLQDTPGDFAVEAMNNRLSSVNRQAGFDKTAVENFLTIAYSKATSFLALSLLYDRTRWGEEAWNKDHIFPKSWFTPQTLDERGIPGDKHEQYLDGCNRVANLQLLTQEENIAKSDKDFEEWIGSQDTEFKRRHLIPEDDELLRFENFEKFVEAREELIRERLAGLFGALGEATI